MVSSAPSLTVSSVPGSQHCSALVFSSYNCFQPAVLWSGCQDWEDCRGGWPGSHSYRWEDGAGQPQCQRHLQHPHRSPPPEGCRQDWLVKATPSYFIIISVLSVLSVSPVLCLLKYSAAEFQITMSGMKDPGMVPRCQAVLNKTVSYGKEKVNLLAERSTSMAFSFLSSFLTIVLVLILSIFLYGTFYFAYIPKDVYKMPLDLQFHPCNESSLRCVLGGGLGCI